MKQVNDVGVDVDSKELVCAKQCAGQRAPLTAFTNTAAGHKKFVRWATKGAHSARVDTSYAPSVSSGSGDPTCCPQRGQTVTVGESAPFARPRTSTCAAMQCGRALRSGMRCRLGSAARSPRACPRSRDRRHTPSEAGCPRSCWHPWGRMRTGGRRQEGHTHRGNGCWGRWR
jgi:hypothetical protein